MPIMTYFAISFGVVAFASGFRFGVVAGISFSLVATFGGAILGTAGEAIANIIRGVYDRRNGDRIATVFASIYLAGMIATIWVSFRMIWIEMPRLLGW